MFALNESFYSSSKGVLYEFCCPCRIVSYISTSLDFLIILFYFHFPRVALRKCCNRLDYRKLTCSSCFLSVLLPLDWSWVYMRWPVPWPRGEYVGRLSSTFHHGLSLSASLAFVFSASELAVFFIFCFQFSHAGHCPCFFSASLPPNPPSSLLYALYLLHLPSCPSRSSLPALPSADDALIILQREVLSLSRHPSLPSFPVLPHIYLQMQRFLSFNLSSSFSCIPLFSLFFPLKIHKAAASWITTIHPFIQPATPLLFLPTGPHPTAVGSKCCRDRAWAKISSPCRSLSMYHLIRINLHPRIQVFLLCSFFLLQTVFFYFSFTSIQVVCSKALPKSL